MKTADYLKMGLDFFILRKNRPYVLGLVTNDTCNLNCKHCRVSNIRNQSMPYDEIERHLKEYYKKGVRFLYIEGGEPYLWKDGLRHLPDVVRLARNIGYLRVHVYTNGTFPLDAHPDFTWISIDGVGETYRTIRGKSIERVLSNIRNFDGRFAVIFTVNTINYKEIPEFLNFGSLQFPQAKVMFFFHTPYYGVDELLLSKPQKEEAIETIIACKEKGLPVLNSRAGLIAILSGRYEHPANLWWVVDQTGEFQCCRAYGKPEVCENCGYSSCAELILSRSLHWGAIKEMMGVY